MFVTPAGSQHRRPAMWPPFSMLPQRRDLPGVSLRSTPG